MQHDISDDVINSILKSHIFDNISDIRISSPNEQKRLLVSIQIYPHWR